MHRISPPLRLSPAQRADLWRPDCMSDEEWAGWRAKNHVISVHGAQASRPCEDCPLGFAAQMRAVGRCNGAPGGVEEDEDMDDPIAIAPAPEAPTTRVRIDLAAPCGRCAHAPICRLRADVEALTSAQVAVPRLGAEVRLELAGTITCDWFARAHPAVWTPERRAAQAARLAAFRARKAAAQP